MYKTELVKMAMLAVQRYPWEQGTAGQALYESGDLTTAAALAHDAVLRQQPDGRLAVINENIAVTDPASNGEVVWRTYERTGDPFYKEAAEKMLNFLLKDAPRSADGIIFHNQVSFDPEFSADQIWADSTFMAPPFIAVMGYVDEAVKQVKGYLRYLRTDGHSLVNHIYDVTKGVFVRKKLWATGNGWNLMGIGRIIDTACAQGKTEAAEEMKTEGVAILDEMLRYQLPDGRFHDILDEDDSFIDGASAMMMATFVFRGIANGWLDRKYAPYALKVSETMENYVDESGIIHEVCGCPNFVSVGTSAESMAAYLMMHAWQEKAGF